MSYTKEQQEQAWQADVVEYLLRYHRSDVKKEGSFLRLKADKKVVFKGRSYFDNGKCEHGGPVDALMKYFGYTAERAIVALAGGEGTETKPTEKKKKGMPHYADMPKPTSERYSRVWAYLHRTRGIPSDMINELMKRHLLYQDERANAVFINPAGDTAEIRGTNSYVPFKSTRRTKQGGFWWYQPEGEHAERAYICESAIDAISLFLLIGDRQAVYVSMAGVGNTAIIDRIARRMPTVICTDNDQAGDEVRMRYGWLYTIRPYGKDFNDDLIELIERGKMNENSTGSEGVPQADGGLAQAS